MLKLIGVFAIFALSLVGYVLPFNIQKIQYLRYYASDNSWTDSSLFCNLKSFSSGIILGVALLHLIAESVESLMDFSDYPCIINFNSASDP